MNIFTKLLQKPSAELTRGETRAVEQYHNHIAAGDNASSKHWLKRAYESLGINTQRSRKATAIVRHDTNRHKRRMEAAKKRKGMVDSGDKSKAT